MKSQTLVLSIIQLVAADLRYDCNQKTLTAADVNATVWRIPSTYNYQGIIKQKDNNNDQFLRSNIDNEANKRKEESEKAYDMTPFRQDAKGTIRSLKRGQIIEVPLRWNNPHDSSCEVNAWIDGLRQVIPIKGAFNCGGGYKDARYTMQIPKDFPGCISAAENCVMQMYGHSVEPRTYAYGYDFVIVGDDNTTITLPAQQPGAPGYNFPSAKAQPAKLYNDALDTSHVDSQYSGYRGQQKPLAHVKAAIDLQAYVGNGGLVPLGNIDKGKNNKVRNQIQNKIKAAEEIKRKENKQAFEALNKNTPKGQPKVCFEGELYGVVNNKNCDREYKNTYVTRVDYGKILAEMMPVFQKENLLPYTPMRKYECGTPLDLYGEYKRNNKPSSSPTSLVAPQQSPPAKGQHIPQPNPAALSSCSPIAPLAGDFKSGPKEQNGAGTHLGSCPKTKKPVEVRPGVPGSGYGTGGQGGVGTNVLPIITPATPPENPAAPNYNDGAKDGTADGSGSQSAPPVNDTAPAAGSPSPPMEGYKSPVTPPPVPTAPAPAAPAYAAPAPAAPATGPEYDSLAAGTEGAAPTTNAAMPATPGSEAAAGPILSSALKTISCTSFTLVLVLFII